MVFERHVADCCGGVGAVGDVVVIPRVARYKAPSTLGKLRDITTAILPQVPSLNQPKPFREQRVVA